MNRVVKGGEDEDCFQDGRDDGGGHVWKFMCAG